MVGAADALEQPRSALRGADIDDEIDVTPIDAKIERRGTDHRPQSAAGHRLFDFAPLRYIKRAVMQRDGEIVVVDLPKLLKNAFGLAAGVDENQRRAMRRDKPVDLVERVPRRVPRPGQPLARVEHGDVRRGAGFCNNKIRMRVRGTAALRHHEACKFLGLRHCRREADAGEMGREPKKPRQAEREQIAALGNDERVQFVEDYAFERTEQKGRVGGGEQERELLRRRQQNLRRIAALTLTLRGRGVAGPRLDADRQPHLGDRGFQVARDIDRECFERRDVKRMQPAFAMQVPAERE